MKCITRDVLATVIIIVFVYTTQNGEGVDRLLYIIILFRWCYMYHRLYIIEEESVEVFCPRVALNMHGLNGLPWSKAS